MLALHRGIGNRRREPFSGRLLVDLDAITLDLRRCCRISTAMPSRIDWYYHRKG